MPLSFKSVKIRIITFLNLRFQLFGAPKINGFIPKKKVVSPAITKENQLPITLENKPHWKFRLVQRVTYPETFVTELSNGRVWGHEGVVITEKNELFSEVSRHYNEQGDNLLVFKHWNIIKPVKKDATIAVLAASGAEVYYHWMMDIMPRVELLLKNGQFETIDYFIIGYTGLSFQKELLQRVNISESQIIASNDYFNFHIQASTLFVPSLVSPNDAPSLSACLFIRKLFEKELSTEKPSRNLYIQRKKGRKIVNEESVTAILREKGFEIIQPEQLNVAAQARLFSEAKFVIGPHGAGMTNLVFCAPNTKVIDIFSPEWVNPCYWILSSHLKLQYAYLTGEGPAVPEHCDPQGKTSDISVDINNLKQLLQLIELAG